MFIDDHTGTLFRNKMSLQCKPSESFDALLDNVNIFSTMVKIAPLKVQSKSCKYKAPWRNTTAVQLQRTECWKADDTKSKFTFITKYEKICYTFIINLYATLDSPFSPASPTITKFCSPPLTNPPTQLAPELVSAEKSNELAFFLITKMHNIRLVISISNST